MTRERLFLAGLALFSGFLFLCTLGDGMLWQDEAETALVAGTVLEGGLPRGTDGRNFFSQNLGLDHTAGHLWRWHPWLQFYVCAASFAALGKGTFAARLPFALFGLATVLLTYRACRAHWEDPRIARFAALLLTLCVPFLLLSRQCRYYPLTAFFFTLTLHGHLGLLKGRRRAGWLFLAGAVPLFHAQYVLWAAALLTSFVHAALFHRARLGSVCRWGAAALALNAPAMAFFLAGNPAAAQIDWSRLGSRLSYFAGQIGDHVFPASVFLLGGGALFLGRERAELTSEARSALGLAAVAVLAVWGLSASFSVGYYFRYLAPLLPVAAVLAGAVAARMARLTGAWGPAAVLLLWAHYHELPAFLRELREDYRGPVEGVVEYLEAHARPDDVVAVAYGDLPLKFYTELKVVGGLTGEDLSPALNARFIIMRHEAVSQKEEAVARYLVENVDWKDYERLDLDAPDIPYENRESIEEHLFTTAEGAPPVVMLRRKT